MPSDPAKRAVYQVQMARLEQKPEKPEKGWRSREAGAGRRSGGSVDAGGG